MVGTGVVRGDGGAGDGVAVAETPAGESDGGAGGGAAVHEARARAAAAARKGRVL